MGNKENLIDFYGGAKATFIPFVLFMIICFIQAATGWANIEGFYVNAFICLIVGMFLSKNKGDYFKALTLGMGSNMVLTAVVCWIFAGAFAGILKVSGLVDGLVWLCLEANVSGGLFVVLTFWIGVLYSSATGTNMGTVTALTMVLYPAGVIMGASPYMMAGAILSAAVFGDNFSPISDTTIVAASTLDVDVPRTVKIRIPYALTATIITTVIYLIIGGYGGTKMASSEYANMLAQYSPKGLLMLIPVFVTVVLAFKGKPLILATTCGIITAIVIGLPTGLLNVQKLVNIAEDGTVTGAIPDGIGGFATFVLLILMCAALSYILQMGGGMTLVLEKLKTSVVKTQRQADVLNYFIIAIAALPLCSGIVPEIVAGPLMKDVCDTYDISRYRAANFNDAVECAFAGILPWGGSTLLICALTPVVHESIGAVPAITDPVSLMPYAVYPIVILLIYLLSAITGIGFKYDAKMWDKYRCELDQ